MTRTNPATTLTSPAWIGASWGCGRGLCDHEVDGVSPQDPIMKKVLVLSIEGPKRYVKVGARRRVGEPLPLHDVGMAKVPFS